MVPIKFKYINVQKNKYTIDQTSCKKLNSHILKKIISCKKLNNHKIIEFVVDKFVVPHQYFYKNIYGNLLSVAIRTTKKKG